jgi:hypothetical protein
MLTINPHSNPRPHKAQIIEHGHSALNFVRRLHGNRSAELGIRISGIYGDYVAFLDSASCPQKGF